MVNTSCLIFIQLYINVMYVIYKITFKAQTVFEVTFAI